MFLPSSRYHKLTTVEYKTRTGRIINVVLLRRLPALAGAVTVIKENDRLDIIAQRQYEDGAMFWRIADANSELKANDLVDEPGREINVPES